MERTLLLAREAGLPTARDWVMTTRKVFDEPSKVVGLSEWRFMTHLRRSLSN